MPDPDPRGAPPALRRETHYGDRIVACFPERPAGLHDLLARAAAARPGGEAVVCGTARLTWAELDAEAARAAGALAARGIGPGVRVALLMGNRSLFVVALFALARLGAIAVPLGIRLQGPEIAGILADCGAALVVHDADLAARLPAGAAALPAEALGAAARTAAPAPATPAAEEDTAVILYTSGTTGRPKGAMLTNLGLVHAGLVYGHALGLTPADRSLAAVPLSHVTGLVANLMAMAAAQGTLVVLPTFKAPLFLALATAERTTHTVIVPAMYALLLMQPDFSAHDLSAWRIGAFGGAPMPVPTIERLARELPGLRLVNAYGATETSSPATIMPPHLTAANLDSVGLPAPGTTIVAVDEAGREVAPGAVGELLIHGAQVVRGYWNAPAATAEGFVGGAWRSGDLGSVDAQGFVRVLDRKKDMINRGGYKVFTAEVESVLAGHPDVAECAVVAKPCPVLGERVHAFVVPRGEAPDAAALQAHCAARLADYKVPESVTWLAEPLPRNANGKVVKRRLRERLAGQA